ncbi:serine/threonine-protein phosphatase 2A activator-like [Cylas formicarius]|uniref:serine/threonine-protein phosphatase 2A activator-like n=1 Tax=Cylas formicarius TaxID=197179 RepID=UPI0029584847|nr:serine/threonine-protein phosphatase 2A activator-like [Cylas formicarius]
MNTSTALKAVISDVHQFITPIKLVKTPEDMLKWDRSEAYLEYMGFIFAINNAVRGTTNSDGSRNASQAVDKIMTLLDRLGHWIDEIPPIQQPQRFGNQAFRSWYNRLQTESITVLQNALPPNLHRALPEIAVYLQESFGNATRIDYGTGHEISFLMFLCALFKIGFLTEADLAATACKIFVKYLTLARKLQQTYRMEPAGSHGVWSLDDYQFVPFIWGSSQLIDHPRLDPTSFLKENIVNSLAEEYMFMSCIQYINSVKTGPFAEHSNQLWSISGVPSWSKINSGLIKMYKVEVLGKFPVVQHITFGSVFTLKPADQGSSIREPKFTGLTPRPGFKKPSDVLNTAKSPDASVKD